MGARAQPKNNFGTAQGVGVGHLKKKKNLSREEKHISNAWGGSREGEL